MPSVKKLPNFLRADYFPDSLLIFIILKRQHGSRSNKIKQHYSFEEYLKPEEDEHIRYEYYEGEVFAMAGGTLNYSYIADNINDSLKTKCKNQVDVLFKEM